MTPDSPTPPSVRCCGGVHLCDRTGHCYADFGQCDAPDRLRARLAEAERQKALAVQRVGAALSALSWCAAGYEVREGAVPDHLTRAMDSLRAFLGDR